MFQPPQSTGMSQSMGSVAQAVPKISQMMVNVDKALILPKKIHITINDPITLEAPKLITDGIEKPKPKLITDGKEKPKAEAKSFIGDLKKALGMKPKSAEATRIKAEAKQKKADERAKARHKMMGGWFKDIGKSLKKGLTDNPIVNFIKDHWGKIMIGAMMLFLKPEQWKNIWEGIKELWNWFKTDGLEILKGIWDVLKKWVPKIAGWIGDLIDNIFGRKVTQEDVANAKKEEGESDADFAERLAGMKKDAAAYEATGNRQGGLFGEGGGIMDKLKGFGSLALLFVTGLTLLTGSFTPIMMALKLFGSGLRLGGKGLRGFARQANKSGLKNAKKGGLRRNARANQLRETRAQNKVSTGDARGKQTGKKIKNVGKVLKNTKAGSKAVGAVSKLGGFLKVGIRGLSKVAAPLAAGMALYDGVTGAMNADEMLGKKKEDLTVRDRIAGGAGGLLSGLTFGLVEASSIAKFVAADPKDPDKTPEAKEAKKKSTAQQPMTKTQFLQSEKYKSQMRGADGVVEGESTAGKQMAYDEYLENQPVIDKQVGVLNKRLKKLGKFPSSAPARKQEVAKINRKLDLDPLSTEIIEGLDPKALKILGRKVGSGGSEDMSTSMKSSDISPMVSPTMKADTLNQVQGENAELGSSNPVVAPITNINNITNNYGSGGENGTAIMGVPTAQQGKKVKHSNIR